MRVVVTGAAGFIGSHVVAALAAASHDVVQLDAMLPAAHPDPTPPPAVQVVDVRDAHRLARLVVGADVVCHQAAMVGAGVDAGDLPSYAAHNDLGTAVLLAEMAKANVGQLVLASSMVVYGEGAYECREHGQVDPLPRRPSDLAAGRFDPLCPSCRTELSWRLVGEEAPLRPRSGYAASKVAQEHLATAWAGQTGGRAIALRYHNVYGPGMPRDTPYAGVAAVFRSSLERGEPPAVFEDGRQTRDFVHVDDVASANLAAVEAVAESESGRPVAFNICSGHPRSVGDLAALVSAAQGGPAPLITGTHRATDVRHIVASPQRAGHQLGFRAKIHPDVGLPTLATAPMR